MDLHPIQRNGTSSRLMLQRLGSALELMSHSACNSTADFSSGLNSEHKKDEHHWQYHSSFDNLSSWSSGWDKETEPCNWLNATKLATMGLGATKNHDNTSLNDDEDGCDHLGVLEMTVKNQDDGNVNCPVCCLAYWWYQHRDGLASDEAGAARKCAIEDVSLKNSYKSNRTRWSKRQWGIAKDECNSRSVLEGKVHNQTLEPSNLRRPKQWVQMIWSQTGLCSFDYL
jgi:hypothetical protein